MGGYDTVHRTICQLCADTVLFACSHTLLLRPFEYHKTCTNTLLLTVLSVKGCYTTGYVVLGATAISTVALTFFK
jgi:hypothetical protein